MFSQPLPSSAEMLNYDQKAIAAGVPALELMERAGKACAEVIRSRFANHLNHVVVLCGPGNNGGDGLVLARELSVHGASQVSVILTASKRYSEECKIQCELIQDFNVSLWMLSGESSADSNTRLSAFRTLTEDALPSMINSASLLVDALLGTGQRGAPRDPIRQILLFCQNVEAPKVSIDIPTGIDADSGAVFDHAFFPQLTIGIQAKKRGLLQFPARARFEKHCLVDIGIDLTPRPQFLEFAPDDAPLSEIAPDAHKGEKGTVLVIGGSSRYRGAPLLCGLAALRSGAGLVRVAGPTNVFSSSPLELIVEALDGESIATRHLSALKALVDSADVVVVGPGMSIEEAVFPALLELIAQRERPLILDAEGLNLLSQHLKDPLTLPNTCILTPHPGEAARLLCSDTSSVQADRYTSVIEISNRYAATVLLKGAQSVVFDGRATPSGYAIDYANPALATAGSGDVLCGIVAALMARNLPALTACSLGAYLHGACAMERSSRSGGPLIASDLISEIPWTLGRHLARFKSTP